jgi:hypothetical protein
MKICFIFLSAFGETHADDIFFVLSHQQINDLITAQDEIGKAKGHHDIGLGFLWGAALPFRDKWHVLPGWPS